MVKITNGSPLISTKDEGVSPQRATCAEMENDHGKISAPTINWWIYTMDIVLHGCLYIGISFVINSVPVDKISAPTINWWIYAMDIVLHGCLYIGISFVINSVPVDKISAPTINWWIYAMDIVLHGCLYIGISFVINSVPVDCWIILRFQCKIS